MLKTIALIVCALLITSEALAASWLKTRGRTNDEAFYNAQEKYGKRLLKKGSCGLKQPDGFIYCDVLIQD